ncbi:MAG: histidine phosphatase family protein [Cellulomonadaceae bacterium]|jgi:probable phosphoglycerate mutase|nr:histidine phosphatase family protein [Cellulomonadaceae bacterium]
MIKLIVECDGGARGNPGVAGFGAVVRGEDGAVLAERAGFLGVATNNVAEYSGLIAGLTAAFAIAPNAQVLVRADSKLVCEQMSGRWKIKNGALIGLARLAAAAFPHERVTYEWVPRELNSAADALANEAMDSEDPEIIRDYVSNLELPNDLADTLPDVGEAETLIEGSLAPPPSAFYGLDSKDCLVLVLVRHGVTDHTMKGRLAGGDTAGAPLSKVGKQMAVAAAKGATEVAATWPDIAPISYLLASPMIRTQQTAAEIGAALNLPVVTDARLREIEFGAWHELTVAEVDAKWPGQFHRMVFEGTFKPPGGESYFECAERVAPVIVELLNNHLGETVGIVGHAAMIRSIIGPALGLPVTNWARLRIPPCSISIVRIWPDAFEGVGSIEVTCVGVPTGPKSGIR